MITLKKVRKKTLILTAIFSLSVKERFTNKQMLFGGDIILSSLFTFSIETLINVQYRQINFISHTTA